MDKNIDFDRVADLYDLHVQTTFDVDFWIREAGSADVLELMCGTGRIGLPLVRRGIAYTGLDYARRMLERFRAKLDSEGLGARLICADARDFELRGRFGRIFIGFHSLAEVLSNADKERVIARARRHLAPDGVFTFSLHNPAVRRRGMDGKRSAPQTFERDGRIVEFSYIFPPPSPDGIAAGRQLYVVRDKEGRVLDERVLDIRFHLIAKPDIESLLGRAGFRVVQVWGNYDRAPYSDDGPFMIFRCMPKG